MFNAHPQIFSPFGAYVFEDHETPCPNHYLRDLPRPDLKLGKDHPLARVVEHETTSLIQQ